MENKFSRSQTIVLALYFNKQRHAGQMWPGIEWSLPLRLKYRNHSNNSTIQLFEHPPPLFQEKCLISVFQAFEHPRLKLYSNIRTPTPRGALTGVPERLLAFDSLCWARVRVTEHLLAYYRRFRTSTRLLLSPRSSNGGCQTCTSLQQSLRSSNSVAKHAIAFNSLCGDWMGVSKRAIAFDSLCGGRTGFPNVLRQSLWSSNGG